MADFLDVYPDSKQIILNYNYRNPCNLITASLKLISNNKNRFDKDIKSTSEEGAIQIFEYEDEIKEAKEIVGQIKQLIDVGVKPSEIAILYRNHADARYIVDGLLGSRIPFYLKESMPNIYSHFVISDIEAFFQIAIGNSTKARILSIMNKPNRYLHRRSVEVGKDLEGMCSFYGDNPGLQQNVQSLIADFNLIKNMSPSAAINYIKNAMGYGQYLLEESLKCNITVEEYTDILTFLKNTLSDCKTLKQAIDKINTLRLKVDYENKSKIDDRSNKVGLYTLHASKGLEFDNVFIVSVNEGLIPTNKADTKEDIEAERRLFYVGITRTKRNLYISYTNKKNRDKSRFLIEMNSKENC
jgi:DNA helicase-2/ATP-dependent DNA helicase PcrA